MPRHPSNFPQRGPQSRPPPPQQPPKQPAEKKEDREKWPPAIQLVQIYVLNDFLYLLLFYYKVFLVLRMVFVTVG